MDEKTIMGIGGSYSANTGEIIVTIFAPKLHKPKAVPANIAGNKRELARKQISNVTLTPQRVTEIM
jgi:hypothetical protein